MASLDIFQTLAVCTMGGGGDAVEGGSAMHRWHSVGGTVRVAYIVFTPVHHAAAGYIINERVTEILYIL